ncbi:MAG: hypothetical protein LBR90_01245 [Elusimicrobiota bacterium]|jgi:hypothetical protein|nr:hypothetical protein [Elusimicrobiota bacterium]
MALIVKSSKSAANASKQAYTWGACILVAVLLITTAIPMLAGGKKNNRDKYRETFYDLAAMPFDSDAGEAQLLASAQYQDIAKTDLINTLFSKKDKEERQAQDAELGPMAPPDEEYKAVADEKARAAAAARQRAALSARPAGRAAAPAARPTTPGNLRSGSTISGGGGTSLSGSIWRGDDKPNPKAGSGQVSAAQIAARLKDGGRATGFADAYAQTMAAGRAKDLEGAAGGAVDAFQGGKDGKEAAPLETALKGDALALGEEGLGEEGVAGLDDLSKAADSLADKADDKVNDTNRDIDNKVDQWNIWRYILEKGVDMLMGAAGKLITGDAGWFNKESDSSGGSGGGSGG